MSTDDVEVDITVQWYNLDTRPTAMQKHPAKHSATLERHKRGRKKKRWETPSTSAPSPSDPPIGRQNIDGFWVGDLA